MTGLECKCFSPNIFEINLLHVYVGATLLLKEVTMVPCFFFFNYRHMQAYVQPGWVHFYNICYNYESGDSSQDIDIKF